MSIIATLRMALASREHTSNDVEVYQYGELLVYSNRFDYRIVRCFSCAHARQIFYEHTK